MRARPAKVGPRAPALRRVRADIAARLRVRRAEIEQALLVRLDAILDSGEATDPAYRDGLREAVGAALDYGLATIERGDERTPPVPALLHSQARLAARSGVSLDSVLRRYFAGYCLLGDFLVEEAGESAELRANSLQQLLRAQATVFDRLVVAVSAEYGHEVKIRPTSSRQRRLERVQKLLAGELIDTSSLEAELGYGFDATHLGMSASGSGAAEVLRWLGDAIEHRPLLLHPDEQTTWAWFGSKRKLLSSELLQLAAESLPDGVTLAIGEPGDGLAGWRLTHRQAAAALQLAHRAGRPVVRYTDVALLASMLRDDLLTASLRKIYLDPLERERDGGTTLRETLRAYFGADRNISSAAMSLKVNRNTVASRLRSAEESLGKSLNSCDLEVALQLELLL